MRKLKITDKFKATKKEGKCSALNTQTYVSILDRKVVFKTYQQAEKFFAFEDHCGISRNGVAYNRFSDCIGSGCLLANLASLFKGNIKIHGRDAYKVTWSFSLVHESGAVITFRDWKSRIGLLTSIDLNREAKKDIKKLISLLVTHDEIHPYWIDQIG